MCKRNLFLFLFALTGFNGFGQISVTNIDTPQELVENVLLGGGVVASNFTFNGVAADATSIQACMGLFNANGTAFPINSGVVMASGNVINVPGTASGFMSDIIGAGVSDPDLLLIEPAGINDACVIEFDFIPAGDTISFQYMFGSEEYPEFVNSGFNDAFGFFISGPGFAGPYSNGAENIALLPGTTTPVTIDNVNAGLNSQFYVDNAGDVFGITSQMDAYTVVLTASASVQCGQVYHIKLAIGDAGDSSYDSAVFLAADSFASPSVNVSVSTVTGDTSIVEGCTDATFIFSRPASDTLDTLIINYDIGGTAIEGIDFSNLIDSVVFLPGEDTVIWNISAFLDQLNEGDEFITITTYTISACGDTLVSIGTLWISDPPVAIMTPSAVQGCQPFSVDFANNSTNGGIGPLTYEWIFTVNDTLMTPTLDTQNFVFNTSSTVYLIAYDQYFCSDTTEVDIVVDICGCTDPNGENYNPLANVDDGSCIYTYPEVTPPNVFTPNGDGINELFELDHKNTLIIDLVILNRWGNEMHSSSAFHPTWDGADAEDGTYFYKYFAHGKIGANGEEEYVEGHGFFQLIRD